MPYPGKTGKKIQQMARGCFANTRKAGKSDAKCHDMMREGSRKRKRSRTTRKG
jgi:hypothetical protein